MTRPVVWSQQALQDLTGQTTHIAMDNPPAGERVSGRILRAAAALGQVPTGRPGRVIGTYEKSVPGLPYILVYRIIGDAGSDFIAIVRLIHSARDWPAWRWPT